MARLRRIDPATPGLTRRRRGKGFELLDAGGTPVRDDATAARVAALVIPPAWREVWISPDPRGHIQATGVDAAGRRQYRYHDDWHRQRARAKFADMEAFAEALPGLRERLEEDLRGTGLGRARVLACTVRLLDRGFFRIGCEDYAERNGTYGLATMRKEHVRLDGEQLVFDFPAKHGLRRVQHVIDPVAAEIVGRLKRRRGGGAELLAYRETTRGAWGDIRSDHINAYLKDRTGLEISAKDFRTWNATVLAAVALSVSDEVGDRSATARKRAEVRAVKEVARYLGNTPAVARSSYIDPRVLDRFGAGTTIDVELDALGDPGAPATHGGLEAAVLELLRDAPVPRAVPPAQADPTGSDAGRPAARAA